MQKIDKGQEVHGSNPTRSAFKNGAPGEDGGTVPTNKKVKFKLNLEISEIFNFNSKRKDIVFTLSSHVDICVTVVT